MAYPGRERMTPECVCHSSGSRGRVRRRREANVVAYSARAFIDAREERARGYLAVMTSSKSSKRYRRAVCKSHVRTPPPGGYHEVEHKVPWELTRLRPGEAFHTVTSRQALVTDAYPPCPILAALSGREGRCRMVEVLCGAMSAGSSHASNPLDILGSDSSAGRLLTAVVDRRTSDRILLVVQPSPIDVTHMYIREFGLPWV